MKSRRGKILGAAAVAVVILIAGAAILLQRSRPNLVVIVVDCLRPDRLQLYGYDRETSPELARIGAESLVFENAFSAGGWTKPAVASLLLGQWAYQHGIVDADSTFPSEYQDVFALLQEAGYETFFFNGGNFFLTKKFGFGKGFSVVENGKRDAASMLDRTMAALQRRQDKPVAAYVHLMDVHLPYPDLAHSRRDPDARSLGELPPTLVDAKFVRRLDADGELTPANRQLLSNVYDEQVRYVDAELGKFWTELHGSGLIDKTLVIIAADHGEEFWEAGRFEHGHALIEEVLRIPMVIGGLGTAPGRSNAPVSLIDIAPTLLAAADIAGPKSHSGRDLRNTLPGNRKLYAGGTLYGNEQLAAIDQGVLTVFQTGAVATKWAMPYDDDYAPMVTAVTLSPSASTSRQDESMSVAVDRQIAKLLRRQFDGMRGSGTTTLDENSLKRLKSLGYSQ